MYMGFLAKQVLKKLASYMWAGLFNRSVKFEMRKVMKQMGGTCKRWEKN